MLLLLDNYDSFTWNVYHFLKSFKVKVQVVRNNKLKASDNYKFEKYKGIVFSPGPGKPENAGEMMNIISNYNCLLYTSPSPRDGLLSRMPSSA